MTDAKGFDWGASAVGWFCVQVFLTVVASVYMFMSQLSIASCTDTSCDYASFALAMDVYFIGAAVLTLGSPVVAVILWRKEWRVSLAPFVATLLLVLLVVCTYVWSVDALDLPLFGGRV